MSFFRTIEISNPTYASDGLKFITVKSANLKGRGDITLFEPEGEFDKPLPLVVLLHGVYGSHWSWAFSAGAHKVAQTLIDAGLIEPVVIAMPSDGLYGDGSSYTAHNDRNFEQWICQDVLQAAREASELVNEDSPNYIAGLSMGGYGAMRIGSRYPQLFKGISGHSSITRFEEHAKFIEEPLEQLHEDYSVQVGMDIVDCLKADRDSLPALRFDCGREDLLIEGNRLLHEQLKAAEIPHIYEEFSGSHTWDYWNEHLADTLKFFASIHKNNKPEGKPV